MKFSKHIDLPGAHDSTQRSGLERYPLDTGTETRAEAHSRYLSPQASCARQVGPGQLCSALHHDLLAARMGGAGARRVVDLPGRRGPGRGEQPARSARLFALTVQAPAHAPQYCAAQPRAPSCLRWRQQLADPAWKASSIASFATTLLFQLSPPPPLLPDSTSF